MVEKLLTVELPSIISTCILARLLDVRAMNGQDAAS